MEKSHPNERLKEAYNNPIKKAVARLSARVAMKVFGLSQAKHPERTRGLIEGAIVAYDLTYPDTTSQQPRLANQRAPSSRWSSYDFNRPREFPVAHSQGKLQLLGMGKLVSMIPHELEDRGTEDLTPTMFLDMYNTDHILNFDTPSVDELVERGIMRATTNGEAYDRVGLYDEYGSELEMRRVVDDPVFQITPKGNTLVSLASDSGSAEPDEFRETQPEWSPVPGMRLLPIQ